MKTLKLSKDLSLPIDVITQTFLIVGKRGSGKSNTAARLVEQFHYAKLPFVVLDPVDTWYGLRSSRDGAGPGLDVYVFGGRKQDLPLEAGAGALIAEVLCEHRISMVLSVKHLSGRERSGFMVDFAKTLFQKWAGGPLHVVLEEAHELAPQSIPKNERAEEMLGAFKRLWKLGRASGIGGSAVTQRPASLSKDITTQSEILIAHRTIGPQDVKAVGEWVKYRGEHEQILGDLPTLPTGDAFVWSPEFPSDKPLGLKRATILLRDTYDSASTPKVGELRVEPKQLADVDLERLRTKMAKTIERAKADDPRELKRLLAQASKDATVKDQRIKQLEAAKSVPAGSSTSNEGKKREVAALTDADRALIEKLATAMDTRAVAAQSTIAQAESKCVGIVTAAVNDFHTTMSEVAFGEAENLQKELDKASVKKLIEKLNGLAIHKPLGLSVTKPFARGPVPANTGRTSPPAASANRTPQAPSSRGIAPRTPSVSQKSDNVALPPGELATLTAALTYPDGLDRKRLGVLTGYKRSSRDAYIARLQAKGLVEVRGQFLHPTDAGHAALNGSFEPLPTGKALIEYWRERLPEGERKTLDVLLSGDDLPRELIDQETGYKRSSRDAYLTRLKARGLVDFVGRGMVRARAELLEGR